MQYFSNKRFSLGKSKFIALAILFVQLFSTVAPLQAFASYDYSCPQGKECKTFDRNDGYTLVPNANPSAGFRAVSGTATQICKEQGYEDSVYGAWEKDYWRSPGDNYQTDFVNGNWTTYGAYGSDKEWWRKITCQKPIPVIVIDVCPNIDGTQETIPEGKIVDSNGDCVVPVPVDNNPIGFLDSAACDVFNGWTYDIDTPADSNLVHFYADGPAGTGIFLGAMLADWARPDINSAYEVLGNHGFSFPTPSSLKDGKSHDIYAYGINTSPANPHDHNQVLMQAWDVLIDHRTISGCTTPVINVNQAPTIPVITGPITGLVSTSYSFTAIANDPESQSIAYGFDWDNNGSVDAWTPIVASGVSQSFSNNWDSIGTKTFSVVAKDSDGAVSTPSTFSIVISSGSVHVAEKPLINSLTVTPVTIDSHASTVVSWTTLYAVSCEATGGWTGVKAISGSETISDLDYDTTFTLKCLGEDSNDSVTKSVTVTVLAPIPDPVISSFVSASAKVVKGSVTNLSWVTTGSTRCEASVGWTGTKAVSGSESTSPLYDTTTFTLVCYNSKNVSTSASVTVLVETGSGNPRDGAVSITALADNHTSENGSSVAIPIALSIAPLATVNIPVTISDWSEGTTTTNLFTFTPSNWSVPQTVVVAGVDDSILDGNISYNISFGPIQSDDVAFNGKSAVSIGLVNYDDEIAPVIYPLSIDSFITSTTSIVFNGSATLTWHATGTASSCITTGGWTGDKSISGSETIQNLTSSADFTIACSGPGGTDSKTVHVDVANQIIVVPPVVVTPDVPQTVTPPRSGGGGGSRNGPCIGNGCPKGVVLGTSTSTVPAGDIWIIIDTPKPRVLGSFCSAYLNEYMRIDRDNNPNEVKKLQRFLNEKEGHHLVVNGVFDDYTYDAVSAFQLKYSEDVLAPWGITDSTGYVYKTTLKKINELECSKVSSVLEQVSDKVSLGSIGDSGTSTISITPNYSNIAGVFGAMTSGMEKIIKGILWYPILILLLLLTALFFTIRAYFLKDKNNPAYHNSSITAGISIAVASLLNAFNNMSFIRDTFPQNLFHLGFDIETLLFLNIANLGTLITIVVITFFTWSFKKEEENPIIF